VINNLYAICKDPFIQTGQSKIKSDVLRLKGVVNQFPNRQKQIKERLRQVDTIVLKRRFALFVISWNQTHTDLQITYDITNYFENRQAVDILSALSKEIYWSFDVLDEARRILESAAYPDQIEHATGYLQEYNKRFMDYALVNEVKRRLK
jgi:hypothetical protein